MDMKYRVSLLPIFEQDVLRISEALQEYPSVAKRLFEELDKKLLMLGDSPYIWPVYQTNPKFRRMLLETIRSSTWWMKVIKELRFTVFYTEKWMPQNTLMLDFGASTSTLC